MLLPMLKEVPASSLGGLMFGVMITVGLPSLYQIQAPRKEPGAREAVQAVAGAVPQAQAEERALAAFLETYRLAPGQNIKLVPPPRPEGMQVWYARKNPKRAALMDNAGAVAFGWRDPDQLRVWAWMSAGSEGWAIQDLPRWMRIDIEPYLIEGEPELLRTVVAGDWIVREGVSAEPLIQSLEAILQRAIRRRITLSIRRVERDVVVARGRYRPSPLPGHAEGEIELYTRKFDRDDDGASGAGRFADFLTRTGEWLGRPILNELETPPKEKIRWHASERDTLAEPRRREDRDEAMVLEHLQEQTGLTFTREKWPMRILFVERPKSSRKP